MIEQLENNIDTNVIPLGYKAFLKDLKERIRSSQLKAAVKVNRELLYLYWEIGNAMLKKQKAEGWGSKISDKLAADLKKEFTDRKGFSPRNLRFMVQFAKEYSDLEIRKQLVSQIPWGHNIILMQRIKNKKERFWYIQETIKNSWSRNVLEAWMNSNLYKRQGKAITNFKSTLSDLQSDLAIQTLKDPYNFDFLTLRKKYDENELEEGLLKHIEKFLIELGQGFAFIGRQYHVEVGKEDYYIDLLFYHLKLRCYCVIELKNTAFKPEYAGKMNFYLSAIDDLVKHKTDNPSMGMILCKTKNNFTADYALRDINKPIGISEYETKIVESLPDDLKGSLPTIEELEAEFSKS